MAGLIKVLIVDDHLVVREGVASILNLEMDIEVVGSAANANETLAQINALNPDVVLMDLKMPGIDGIQLTRLVKNKMPNIKVIILTFYDQYAVDAAKVGATGYLLKDVSHEELSDTIRRVHAGETVFDKRISPIPAQPGMPPQDAESTILTREAEQVLDAGSKVYPQARVYILPPASATESLNFTSVAEEVLSGDFKQVEGSWVDGLSVTFDLHDSLSEDQISDRIARIPNIEVFPLGAVEELSDMQNLARKQQEYDARHKTVKTVLVRLNVAD